MRDFRDTKAMAHTLRAALVTKGLKVTVSQSLELIAQPFGVADWNTLSAAISAGRLVPVTKPRRLMFPRTATLHRALACATERKHPYETLEHLLLALVDDVDASAVMRACKVELGALKHKPTHYVDNDLKPRVIDNGGEPAYRTFANTTHAIPHTHATKPLNRPAATMIIAIITPRQIHRRDDGNGPKLCSTISTPNVTTIP
jgi:hypothetical protein